MYKARSRVLLVVKGPEAFYSHTFVLFFKSLETMAILIRQLSYIHPDREPLFRDISFSLLAGEKAALIGHNGSGKSTLLQLLAGNLSPFSGEIHCDTTPYLVPQHFGQYDGQTIAQALGVNQKIRALHAILSGDTSETHFSTLEDDWNIEERMAAALSEWGLETIPTERIMGTLSGGEKTRVFLAGISLHNPDIVLMDEPTNHLDTGSREQLYRLFENSPATILAVSHDRTLLNRLSAMYEMGPGGISFYPGNYQTYKDAKNRETDALQSHLDEKEKQLRAAQKMAREAARRKEKHEARGKKQGEKQGLGKMAMGTLKNSAERSASKIRDIHSQKVESLAGQASGIRRSLPQDRAIKVDFHTPDAHKGKILVETQAVNQSFGHNPLWAEPLDIKIRSGERIRVEGANGSGKTSLLKILSGEVVPSSGTVQRAGFSYVYLDQDYSIVRDDLSVFEQARAFNGEMEEHELKTILNRFLFRKETWDKPCRQLSGGEKMRLALCCLMVRADTPELFILDEPTNNLDIRNTEILTRVVREYGGTLLVVSHDEYFIDQVGIERSVKLIPAIRDGF